MAWLAQHHGVVRLADLERLGVTPAQWNRLLRTGVLQLYVRGVYRLAGAPQTTDQAAALACAAGPDVVVSHVSAGRAWALRRLGGDRRLHVLVAGQAHQLLPAVVVHRCHHIDPVDVVERPDGIRITSPPRTVFDLAAIIDDERLESIIEQVVHDGLVTIPTLVATGLRLRQRGRTGSARYGRVLQSRPAWLKPVDSDLELLVERAIIAAGLPRPVRQAPIVLHTGEVIHPDFYWPSHAQVLEIDHVTWHGGKLDLTVDKRRDRLLQRLGINSSRITDQDVRERLPAVIDDLRAILKRTDVRSAS
jgi:very-short-patch-repair endonuclease